MPIATTHAIGTFCWPELATSDAEAGKKFYAALFGWQIEDQDMGPHGFYTIFKHKGVDVAAGFKLMPDMVKMGVPPNWGAYIAVENADASAELAKSLGGQVVMGPTDVMEHGRLAVITDPQGATFTVWQAKKNIGVGILNEPGSLGWTQLNAKDPEAAKKFYSALIGWKVQDDPMPAAMGGGHYTTWLKSDGPAGGMMAMPPDAPAPSHWLSYFAVANVDESAAKAASLGGLTYVPPTDIPGTGRFAVLADPQGAVFALITFLPRG
ncbi:MAG: VOC family protein [Candidatus Eisenbacteria bacterium]